MLNLDTHILLLALSGTLTGSERKLLRKHEWSVSAIVLWEIAKLVQLGRVEVDLNSIEFGRLFSQLSVIPIDIAIARTSTQLDFKSDPADELIAATSLVYKIPLVTRDRRILASRMIPFAG